MVAEVESGSCCREDRRGPARLQNLEQAGRGLPGAPGGVALPTPRLQPKTPTPDSGWEQSGGESGPSEATTLGQAARAAPKAQGTPDR